MSSTKEELDQLKHEMAIAKYARYILADLRCKAPELIGWYADWEQYFTEALERTSLFDPENNTTRLKDLPLTQRLYVDTEDERKRELKYARDGLRANLRTDHTSPEEAFQLFCEAMHDQLQYPPDGLIAEEVLYVSSLLKVRDPITKKKYPAPEDEH